MVPLHKNSAFIIYYLATPIQGCTVSLALKKPSITADNIRPDTLNINVGILTHLNGPIFSHYSAQFDLCTNNITAELILVNFTMLYNAMGLAITHKMAILKRLDLLMLCPSSLLEQI